MQSLLQSAVDSESTKTPDISVFGGFAYADVPEAGFSVVGTCDRSGQEDIQNACKTIAMEAYERREEFQRSYTSVDQAVIKAEEWEPERRGGPLLLADIADNPGGGSAQDDITILKGLLESNVENAALATIIDPEVVKAARKSGIGATITVTIGDYFHERDSSLEVTGQVRNLSDGIYQNRGPMSTGMTVKFGPTTVINLDGIDVIVGSYRQQPYDPQAFESQGIKPESNSVLVLKSTVHFRAGFEPIVGDICEVVTSGSCTPDLSEFYYKNIQRPMYPIDTDL
jgi:microcystin degradation protein MlrC